jgi:hypothetical protein
MAYNAKIQSLAASQAHHSPLYFNSDHPWSLRCEVEVHWRSERCVVRYAGWRMVEIKEWVNRTEAESRRMLMLNKVKMSADKNRQGESVWCGVEQVAPLQSREVSSLL